MKKNKLVNIVLVTIITFAIIFAAKSSFAANNTNFINLTDTLTGNTTNNTVNNTVNNTANSTTNTTVNNTVRNTTTNNTVNNTTTNVLRTNNTANINNNSNLPNTGIEDVFPGVVIVVVLGISALYAYNRIQYYKNI